MPIPKNKSILKNNHLDALRKKFFALCREWEVDAVEMKGSVKLKYRVEHFDELTEAQLELTISEMEPKGGVPKWPKY